jgi:hypothetical protein
MNNPIQTGESRPDMGGALERRTLQAMDAAFHNLNAGAVGNEFDLSEVQDLLSEP